MNAYTSAALVAIFLVPLPARSAEPQPPRSPAPPSRSFDASLSADRWVEQLEDSIDRLQEDLYYNRGTYPAGLQEKVDYASVAVAQYRETMHGGGRRRLMRQFQEMDEKVHELVEMLERSGDPWLRRQASRISYPDEQLHYALRISPDNREDVDTALLARHAHLLVREATSLQDVGDRVNRQDQRLSKAIGNFVQAAEHFHEVAENDADLGHLRRDFEDLDSAWHEVVEYINQSRYGFYFRRAAQNVNNVHNQIHILINRQDGPPVLATPVRPRPGPPLPNLPGDDPRPVEPVRERPAIQFSIPGIGNFRIPR